MCVFLPTCLSVCLVVCVSAHSVTTSNRQASAQCCKCVYAYQRKCVVTLLHKQTNNCVCAVVLVCMNRTDNMCLSGQVSFCMRELVPICLSFYSSAQLSVHTKKQAYRLYYSAIRIGGSGWRRFGSGWRCVLIYNRLNRSVSLPLKPIPKTGSRLFVLAGD